MLQKTPPAVPHPVVVIGGGPVGLAAASELVLRGLKPVVIEAGTQIAQHVREWAHVRMFSPWRYNVSKAAAELLSEEGWTAPDPDAHPTGADVISQYLQPLAATPSIRSSLRLGTRVEAVARAGLDKAKTETRDERPFIVRTLDASGQEDEVLASAVIDTSGTWGAPNPGGSQGLHVARREGARITNCLRNARRGRITAPTLCKAKSRRLGQRPLGARNALGAGVATGGRAGDFSRVAPSESRHAARVRRR